MSEYSILYLCPKCCKWQNRLCRVKNSEVITDKLILQKASKTYLTCKYCGVVSKWSNLNPEHKKFDNILESKSGQLNKEELR